MPRSSTPSSRKRAENTVAGRGRGGRPGACPSDSSPRKESPMHAPVRTLLLSCPAVVLALLAAPAGAAEPAAVPRYRLQVGQELVYSGSSTFKYTNGQLNDRSSW